MRPWIVAALLGILASPVLAGCGETTDQKVRDTVERFGTATRAKDYQTLCDDLFAPQLVANVRSVGLPCEVAMQTSLGKVKRPTLTVDSVQVAGDQALALVHSGAEGERPSQDTIKLVRQNGKWYIASLASAEPQPPVPGALPSGPASTGR